MFAGDGEDMRHLPLWMREANFGAAPGPSHQGHLHRLLEQGEIGPDLFRAACNMGSEGLISKGRDRPYRAGRSPG